MNKVHLLTSFRLLIESPGFSPALFWLSSS